MKNIKLTYIGGGSKMWARVFMTDLALANDLGGEIALYDIDVESAYINKRIGERINLDEKAKSKFKYEVYENIDDALKGADFVVISILPGTFEEMRVDVHLPQKYGINQSGGDTVGPGGILRAMRTVPLYEGFAKAIERNCPKAIVINLTNPMSICVKTLYDVFPAIKAFGCCHEVFHAQEFLTLVLSEITNTPRLDRKDIKTDISGINHFTFISEATYKGEDLFKYIKPFEDKYYEEGYYEKPSAPRFLFKEDPFAYSNKVKMKLFDIYKVLPAAGDRHLVEFLPHNWFLKDEKTIKEYGFNLTSVDYRIKQCEERIKESRLIAEGKKNLVLEKSDEECVDLIEALLGKKEILSNVNLPNEGQVSYLDKDVIVESNCIFSKGSFKPIKSKEVPLEVASLIRRNATNILNTYIGIKNRDLDMIFEAFINEPLMSSLTLEESKELFKEMIKGTRKYLDPYYKDIDKYLLS